MGLSSFPSAAEGMLPVLVMNTVFSVAILKNLLKSVLEIIGAAASGGSSWVSSNLEEDSPEVGRAAGSARRRRVSITQFKSLCDVAGTSGAAAEGGGCGGCQAVECSVCLTKFEEEEEVSELSCKHFFHRSCLDKWFDNQHSTCPLCRSIY